VTAPLSQRAANLRGIVAILCGQALFVGSDSVVKLAGETMPATQIMAIRGLIAVALMAVYVAATTDLERWRLLLRPLVVIRATLEAALAVLFLLALPHMPLADITVTQQIVPLVLTVLSAVILGEAVGWRRWAAVVIGFAGVAMVLQPTGEGFNVYAILALLCALFVAFRDLLTRKLHDAIPTSIVTLGSTISVCLAGFVGAPLQNWQPLSLYVAALLAASAILVSVANMFIVRAFRGVEVSVVVPFRYAAVVWATLLGFVIWGYIPNALAIAGTVIIVASGLYTMHREAMRPGTAG
jgi:drug/metabolite transporter (DMT)-like permease